MANEREYISNYSGKQIDDGIAAIPQLEQRIVNIENSIAGEGDEGLGVTIGALDTRITNNSNAIVDIKDMLLPAKVNLSDYNNRVGGIETQVQNLNTDIGELEGAISRKASSADLISAKSELNTKITNIDTAYKQADNQLDDKIDDVEESLTATMSDLSLTVSGHTTKIAEMENKVNSTQTDANIADINRRISLLETEKVDQSELDKTNLNVSLLDNDLNDLSNTISGHTTSINNLSENKVEKLVFDELVSRVAALEEDTTTEGLTSQIEELQGSIRDILTDLEVIKADIAALKQQTPTT